MGFWKQEFWNAARDLVRGAFASVHAHRLRWMAAALAGGIATGLLIPGDVARSLAWFGERDVALVRLCGRIGYWGELHRLPLLIVAALWLAGWALKRDLWRRAALAALLAGLSAGLVASVVKGLTGRPRPMMTLGLETGRQLVADGFTGPTFRHDFQSFPSGHATHCTAMAAALLVAAPPVGVVAVAGAGVVSWSRMYFHRHYAGDVTGGIVLGGLVGTALGIAARRRRATPPAA